MFGIADIKDGVLGFQQDPCAFRKFADGTNEGNVVDRRGDIFALCGVVPDELDDVAASEKKRCQSQLVENSVRLNLGVGP